MLDLGFVRDNLQLVKQKMRERGLPDSLEDFENLDRERRKLLTEAEALKARRNQLSEETASRKRQGQDASAQIAESKGLGAEITRRDERATAYDEQLRELLRNIPNIPHQTVPVGEGPQHNREHSYTEVLPPFIVNSASLYGTGNLPKFAGDLFRLEGTDYWLVPTAEVPVTNLYRDEVLEAESLPVKHCAGTSC